MDSIWAWEHPYGPVRMPCGLANICTISGAGPYGVQLGPGLATGSLVSDTYGARELLGSFM